MRVTIFILVILLSLSACAPPPEPLPGTVELPVLNTPAPASPEPRDLAGTALPPASSPSPTKLPSLETPLANPASEALVEKAVQMLADKLRIDPTVITLFNLKAMDWPDESLGCPLGGRNYAQVITPGYLVELKIDESIYVFHTDRGSRVVLCGIAPTREIYQPP